MAKTKKYIGFDVGGTKTSAILFDGKQIIHAIKFRTPRNKKTLLKHLENATNELAGNEKVAGYGFGIAGILDEDREVMLKSPNMKFLDGVKVKKELEKIFGRNVRLDNDVNCFLRGELKFGKKSKAKTVAALTVGTGVGGAVLVNGEVLPLAEFGQTVIDIDKKPLTVEQLISSHGFQRFVISDPKECEDRARAGDKKAKAIYDQVGFYLGVAIANIVNIFAPDEVIIGGSISNSDYLIMKPAQKAMEQVAILPKKQLPRLRISKLDHSAEKGAISLFLS